MPARPNRLRWRAGTKDASGQKVERYLGAGAGGTRVNATELVDQCEHGDEHRQPDAESWTVGDHDDEHEEEKPGSDVHGEPEQPKRRL